MDEPKTNVKVIITITDDKVEGTVEGGANEARLVSGLTESYTTLLKTITNEHRKRCLETSCHLELMTQSIIGGIDKVFESHEVKHKHEHDKS